MIPKIIHYCWFGRGERPVIIRKCMASWQKYMPKWKIIEWNEDNFDIESHPYVKDALARHKWAFASDYVRIFALNAWGGYI